jgi:hypothetical protein
VFFLWIEALLGSVPEFSLYAQLPLSPILEFCACSDMAVYPRMIGCSLPMRSDRCCVAGFRVGINQHASF